MRTTYADNLATKQAPRTHTTRPAVRAAVCMYKSGRSRPDHSQTGPFFFFFLMVVNLKPSQPGDNQIVHEIAGGGFFNSHPRGAYVITELYRGCTRERFYLISRYFVVKQDVPYLPTSRSR